MTERAKKVIAVGASNFKKLVTESDIFVDKSLFIKEIIDSKKEAILITRPRRWGKSLNLHMLKTFFAIEADEAGKQKAENINKVLFIGGNCEIQKNNKTLIKKLFPLKIANVRDNDGDSYVESYQGQFPVIYVNFKDARRNSFEKIKSCLEDLIKNVYKENKYLKQSSKLDDIDKKDFQKYIDKKYEEISLEDSLRFLSELLYKHHGKLVYILIDEYDKPVNYLLEQNIKDPEIIRSTAELLSGIFSACGKDNPYLKQIVLTGIFDALKKESNSGFNNLEVFGIREAKFAKSFGFSNEEVEKLVKELNVEASKKVKVIGNIKEWYNGYRISLGEGEYQETYTAWSVMKYLADLNDDSTKKLESYWEKSGVNWILKKVTLDDETLNKMKKISDTETIALREPRHGLIEIFEEGEITEEMITYLLFNSGYLTLADDDGEYRLPNREVEESFREEVIKKWMKRELNTLGHTNSIVRELQHALENRGNFISKVQSLLLDKMVAGEKTEAYFQSLIGGAIELCNIVDLSEAKYQVLTEKIVLKGGRIDNIFYPLRKESDTVVIQEYKKLDRTVDVEIEQILEEGMWQILEKKYLAEPLAKKKYHENQHRWVKILIRSVLFYADENTGKWSVKAEEKVLNIEEAGKIAEVFEGKVNRESLLEKFSAANVYELVENIKSLDVLNNR